jgi:hypothetical protein
MHSPSPTTVTYPTASTPIAAESQVGAASQLKKANWATKREIIRAVVQRIEIEPANIAIVLRLPTETSASGVEPIVATFSRA